MTRIDFYFNVSDKPKLLAQLVETAIAKHRQVVVLAPDDAMAKRVSDYLWQENATSFLPNSYANHSHAARSPVVIGLQGGYLDTSFKHDDMLINLASNEPSIFSRFTQLVEMVSDEEDDKLAARVRYKFYRDRGYDIKNINHAQI
jgi:DNA polymerase III subunit chi